MIAFLLELFAGWDVETLLAYLSLLCLAVWITPMTWAEPLDVLASHFNQHIRDNLIALREGGIAIASQAANDFIFAASATQLGRLEAVAGQTPQYSGSAWEMATISAVTWPVGSVVEFVVATNPATIFGYGTWVAFGAGRVTVCIDGTQTEFDTVEETGGAKTHTLSSAEMPVHTHIQNSHNHTQNSHDHSLSNIGDTVSVAIIDQDISVVDNSGTKTTSSETATNNAETATNQNAGGGGAHNNLQPYVVVYRWKRTA